ncbi:MAG: caspase family protein, partial [Pseudomonadota bacterium]
MPKKIAICVGQNRYAPESGVSPLNGCINDALLIGEMLRKAGFDRVRQVHDQQATQAGILGRLEDAVASLGVGDHLVFWNSSHGYQVTDTSGDELYDHMDEAICSHDTDARSPLTD